MIYESVKTVESAVAPGVTFTVARMSFARRVELMRRVQELVRRMEFLEASGRAGDQMEATLQKAEVGRLYLAWGLRGIAGLEVDGAKATPELLAEAGPESLFQEALAAVRAEAGLTEAERKN
jgi:hypothetical protein